MKLHPIENGDDVQKVAIRMLEIAQQYFPEAVKLHQAIADDERLNRIDLVETGFIMGAAFAVTQMLQGRIKDLNRG